MVATLKEAFGNINPKCDKCTSRRNVFNWDDYYAQGISSTHSQCENSIFYSKEHGSYQNGWWGGDGKCRPEENTGCLVGTVVSSCQEAKHGGSLKKPLCIGKKVDNYNDDNDNNLCNVFDRDASNYYFTQTDTQPGQEKYNICDKQGITGGYWKVGDECQFRKPSNNPPPSPSCTSDLKEICKRNNCCN